MGWVVVCFSVLQCVAVVSWSTVGSVLQWVGLLCVSVCCSVLQSFHGVSSLLQCVSVCCRVYQCVAVCCSRFLDYIE